MKKSCKITVGTIIVTFIALMAAAIAWISLHKNDEVEEYSSIGDC